MEDRSGRFGGRLSAVLYLMCGGLVTFAVQLVPSAHGANRHGLVAVGGVTVLCGIVLWLLPWHRWRRSSTLLIVPPTFVLIGIYNFCADADGYRYAPFFFVTFAWVGLVHARWTSTKIVPLAAAAYLLPLAISGHWNPVTVWSVVYVLPSGVLLGEAVAWVADQLVRTQRLLREREASFRQLFHRNPQPMWVFDLDDLRFLEVNDAAIAHYGYRRDEFLAMRTTDIRPAEDVPALIDDIAGAPALHHTQSWRHILKDGRTIEVDITAHRLEFQGRMARLVAVQDVTERNELERQLQHRAFHDALTELANRSLFANRLEHALARFHRTDNAVGVAVLDLDAFKTINDSLGHTLGDQMLIAVSDRLRDAVRPGDTVARLGGDEFAILFEAVESADEASNLAGEVLASLRQSFVLGDKVIVVTASAGVTVNHPGDGPDELIRNADMAMYLAKRDGKACVRTFEPALHHAVLERLELEADLRRAVSRNEFVIHYQPTVDLATDRICGFEALARWRHPRRGLLAPAEFIPLAEETGLIVDIGRWVLNEACKQVHTWREGHGIDLSMSVNLSARQLRDPQLAADVNEALADSGLDATNLVLEITETVLMDTDTAVQLLQQLKTIGVRIAVDDFGTGYSSLNYLRALPVDILKIDKAFVDGVASDKEAVGLIKAILAMAKTLDLETIAEGVESREQATTLKRLGSARVQGFYYARPMPSETAETLLRSTTALTGQGVTVSQPVRRDTRSPASRS